MPKERRNTEFRHQIRYSVAKSSSCLVRATVDQDSQNIRVGLILSWASVIGSRSTGSFCRLMVFILLRLRIKSLCCCVSADWLI